MVNTRICLTATSVALLLAGCGGGGSGSVASTGKPLAVPAPAPAASPAPAPAPTPTPEVAQIFSTPLHNDDLAVLGKARQWDHVPGAPGTSTNVRDADALLIRYDAASSSYKVTTPLLGTGTLFRVSPSEMLDLSSSFRTYAARVADSPNEATQAISGLRVLLANTAETTYSYASWVWLSAEERIGSNRSTAVDGIFGVAQPTRPGDVPVTGTAKYSGDLVGQFDGDAGATWLEGTARLDFDFAKAVLAGNMIATMRCFMGCRYDNVTYSFADTHFDRGATTFAGALTTPGTSSRGSFSGIFAGPGAAELMAQFDLPFFHPEFSKWIPASGIMLGKRD